jgi:hypothetical protein
MGGVLGGPVGPDACDDGRDVGPGWSGGADVRATVVEDLHKSLALLKALVWILFSALLERAVVGPGAVERNEDVLLALETMLDTLCLLQQPAAVTVDGSAPCLSHRGEAFQLHAATAIYPHS